VSVTRAQVAIACSITERTVNRLAVEGVIPRDSRGEYDLGRCMMAYIRYLQAAMKAKSVMDDSGRISNTAGQRSEMLDVGVALEKLKLAKALGEVMSIADYEARLSNLVIETRAALMAVGQRVAPRLVGETSRVTIQAVIDAGQREAMLKLSRSTLTAQPAKPVKSVAKKSEPASRTTTNPLIPPPLQAARDELGALLAALLERRQGGARRPRGPSRARRPTDG
jgi:hypothetical protein